MFTEYAQQFSLLITDLQQVMPYALMIVGSLYVIQFLNLLVGYRLNLLGIYPRHPFGLVGVVFSPFLHGDFNHLFFNSVPLFFLLCFMLLMGWKTFYVVTAIIVVSSGLGTWLFGRKGIHVGASSLIMGYWSFLLVNAYYHPNLTSIFPAFICVYYFGGLLFSLFPQAEKSSFEGHIFGFLSGLLAAYLLLFIPVSYLQ